MFCLILRFFELGLISGNSTRGSGSLVFNDGESLAISEGQLQAAYLEEKLILIWVKCAIISLNQTILLGSRVM